MKGYFGADLVGSDLDMFVVRDTVKFVEWLNKHNVQELMNIRVLTQKWVPEGVAIFTDGRNILKVINIGDES